MNNLGVGLKQKGVGLVEVLIALLVFSVGMLGVASLQVVASKSTFEAQQRQEAVYLANEILARMASSGMSLAQIKTAYSDDFNTDGISDYGTDCSAGVCTQAQMASWDKYMWKMAVSAASVTHTSGGQGLIGAKGCVDFDETNNRIKVVVAWKSMTKIGDGSSNTWCLLDNDAPLEQRHVELSWCPQTGCL